VNPSCPWLLSRTDRARGRPASVTVDSTIAFGSGSPAAAASASQPENCATGSGASIASSRPGPRRSPGPNRSPGLDRPPGPDRPPGSPGPPGPAAPAGQAAWGAPDG